MPTTTKGDLVDIALRKAGIASSSTLTTPDPESIDDALTDLELMMAEWGDLSIRLNYQFADPEIGADTGDEHGLPASAINGVALSLAKRMLIDMLRPVPDALANAAEESYQALVTGNITVPSLVRRGDMPTGAGNKHSKFYVEPQVQK